MWIMNFYDLIKNFYCTRRAALNAILNERINDEIVRSSSDDTENFTEPSGGKWRGFMYTSSESGIEFELSEHLRGSFEILIKIYLFSLHIWIWWWLRRQRRRERGGGEVTTWAKLIKNSSRAARMELRANPWSWRT